MPLVLYMVVLEVGSFLSHIMMVFVECKPEIHEQSYCGDHRIPLASFLKVLEDYFCCFSCFGIHTENDDIYTEVLKSELDLKKVLLG